MQPRLFFYVQHLLGIGHLVRASRIAKVLSERFAVLLVVGGERPPGVMPEDVARLELPPVRVGPQGFGSLVHADGSPFEEHHRAARRDKLLAAFEAERPDVVLTEAFPFGRRQMRFELLPLLDRAAAAPHRPLIACSVRDILQDAKPERRAETLALIDRYYGLVLVHGDPRLARLADSFPEAQRFDRLTRYTGMVGPEPGPGAAETFDVVVSVGGGAVGAKLVAAALAARPFSGLARARWLVLTGPNARQGEGTGPDGSGVTVRRFAPDLPALMARARVSVSQAGYNTAADLLAARCRAVLVPYAEGGETEQSRRATGFAERNRAVVLDEADLDPVTLAAAIDRALLLPDPADDVALDGAAVTRDLLVQTLERGRDDEAGSPRRPGQNRPGGSR